MSLLRPRRPLDWLALTLVGALVVGGGMSVWWLSRHAVAVHRLTRGIGDTVFYGADGRPWFTLDAQRRDVPLSAIALDFQHAVVAIEDRRFYRHPGIDPIGIARAIYRDVREGAAVEGGSTLTQQLARTLYLSNARTYGRKAKEAAIAILIEAQLTKEQILELYLNRVYLSAGVYGVEAMSQHVFRKPARSLTLAESAFIAGLLKAPSALSPWSNYAGALERSRAGAGGDAGTGFHHGRTGKCGPGRAAEGPAVSSASRYGRRMGEGLSPTAVPERVWRRSPTRLEGSHHVPAATCRRRPNARWRQACSA